MGWSYDINECEWKRWHRNSTTISTQLTEHRILLCIYSPTCCLNFLNQKSLYFFINHSFNIGNQDFHFGFKLIFKLLKWQSYLFIMITKY